MDERQNQPRKSTIGLAKKQSTLGNHTTLIQMIQQFGEIWRNVDYFELDWRFDPYQPRDNHLCTILSFVVHIVAMHVRSVPLPSPKRKVTIRI